MEESDLILAKKVRRKSCESSLNELIKRHSPLCMDIYRKYFDAITSVGIVFEDVVSQKDAVIFEAAKKYKKKKSKFSTWLGNCVRYQCLNILKKEKKYVRLKESEIDTLIEKDDNFSPTCLDKNFEEYIKKILSELEDSRIKDIFIMRYFDKDYEEMPWREIAKKLNIAQQTAINLHETGINILKNRIKK